MLDQLDIAIHETAHRAPGGLPALARTMGLNEQVLRNKVNPTTDSNKLNVREMLAIIDIANDDQILRVLASMRGYRLESNTQADAPGIVSAMLAADAEHGDVPRAISESIADGKLTERERANIIKQINEARARLDVLSSTVLHAPASIGKLA